MKIILIGPPGSGKGTQAVRLRERYGARHISSGDVLRSEVARKTDLGKKISYYMDRGEIGPVELITEAILEYIGRNAPDSFILDGFPRTTYQAEELEKRHRVDAVIFIDVRPDEIVRRILGRRTCGNCGAVYHVSSSPPAREGICDRCGTALTRRSDDTEETVLNRLRVYDNETRPLVRHYEELGLLRRVDGSRTGDDVFSEITGLLE
jgi:adenylate kinase